LSDPYNPENQANIKLQKGDILFIRPDINLKFRYRVIVDGEVKYPGEYVIERGESLESVLKRAGGLTDLAYPYGTIFIRQKIQMKQNKMLRDTINYELMNIVKDEMRILEKDITEKEKTDYINTLELRKEILKSVLVNLKPVVDVDLLADKIMKRVKDNITTEKVKVTQIKDLEEEMRNLREKLYILKAEGLKSDKSSEIDEKLRIDILNRLNTMMTLVSDFKNEFYSDKNQVPGAFEIREGEVKELIKNELNSFMELYVSQFSNIDKIEIESIKPDKLMTKLGIQSELYESVFPSLYQEGEYFEGAVGKLPISLAGRMVVDIEKDDVKLEDGDVILVPKIPDSVIVTGEVNNPVSIYYEEGKSYKYYLNKAGGLKRNADKKGIYVLKANGSAESRSTGFSKIQRGDIIVAPGKLL
jgi:protein involved in polysaccharide export with SLBB domain